jgi:putative N6-adenine-specific DNA methylase
MDNPQSYRYIITCPKGIAPYLHAEIELLGYQARERGPAAIELTADGDAMYRLNLWLRCAHRVLLFLANGVACNAHQLYQWAIRLPWEDHIVPSSVVTVTASVRTKTVRNTLYACQKLKDAIADRLRNVFGRRPNSDGKRKGVVIFLYWRDDEVSVYLDTTGIPLSKRGYRRDPAQAPVAETLAAAILYATKWNAHEPLVAPMCGSGTFAIEAALIAQNTPPSLHRKDFAFQHWRAYQPERWADVRARALDGIRTCSTVIIACDHDQRALVAARTNAQAASVEKSIEFHHCDYRTMPLPSPPATIIVNPPYGLRLSDQERTSLLYKELGDWFKNSCAGMRGYVLTTPQNAKSIGLRPKRRHVFYNADIECRLLEYDLYRGRKSTPSTNELD